MTDNLYRVQTGFLHFYDSRLKLIILPFLLLFFFMPLPPHVLWTACSMLGLILILSLGFREIFMPLKLIYPILILITVLTPLLYRSGETVVQLYSFVILTERALDEILIFTSRFTAISFVFFLLFRTTSMEDLLLALSWFRLPYTATLVISIALRYIPHLSSLYGQIQAAHSMRCSYSDPPVRRNKFSSKLKMLFPTLVSLMIQSVKAIPVLAMALELKGIGRRNPRTRLRILPEPHYLFFQVFSSILMLVLLGTALIVFR